MRWLTVTTLAAVLAVALLTQTRTTAQVAIGEVVGSTPGVGMTSNRVAIAALTAPELARTGDLISRMTANRELLVSEVHDDPAIAGRRHEMLLQFYRGIPVEGGGVTRQLAGEATVSIFGTIFTDIAIDVAPALSAGDVARLVERAAGRELAFGIQPTLVILSSPTGAYVLAYKATVATAITYFVDAATGQVLRTVDEKKNDVGVGTGVLGDQKKMSTALVSGTFRTRDTLRPAGISTFDTGGSSTVFDRLLGGTATDADLASDTDNTWTDGRIVDAHANTGFTYDYFFKRHNWAGLDGLNRPISDIVHRGLKNNAFFTPPPFGPGRNGAMAYGETTAGVPMTALDVAAHELMHGVTHFSLARRTGQGLLNNAVVDGFGPTSFTSGASSFPCNTTLLVDANNIPRAFWCNAGRYVLGSDHGGALNEAFSDVFGTSVEFFFQQPGSGNLRADYLLGEDIAGFGPNRSLINPSAITIPTDSSTLPYPDHRTRLFSFAMVVIQGTQANPTVVDFSPIAFVNGTQALFFTRGTDGGGVHWNSTVFSHAFYLAVEGGRNATSNLNVTGVGAANRALVERAFFRAMTQLMPNSPSEGTAALAVYQAAVDLFGASSATAQALAQAFIAVGLLVAA